MDLWALDDDLELPDEVEKEEAAPVSPGPGKEIPAARERDPKRSRDADPGAKKSEEPGDESIRMNVNKAGVRKRSSVPISGPATPESDFDDLEHWEDVKLEPVMEDIPDMGEPIRIEPEEEPVMVAEEPAEVVEPPPAEADSDDEFSPAMRKDAVPVSLRPHLNLTKAERIGLIALAVLIFGAGFSFFLISLYRLPTEAVKAESRDFPIKGGHVTITSALSYWRAPIREGPDADTFRRGTVLLPVLELGVNGGPAAIRVLFRNEDQTVIGDAVTRSVAGADRLTVAATAGFDDLGMHAAYRTGESKPWTIEVYEARTEDASGKNFEKLFEMNISTDRR